MSTLVGKAAPAFKLDAVIKGSFKSVSLEDHKGKWLVVFFYPLDFTFVCPTEILAFSDRYAEFKKLKTEVVGVSVDSKYTHLAWTERERKLGGIKGLEYPLLADLNKKMAVDYGRAHRRGRGLRGLFIIDPMASSSTRRSTTWASVAASMRRSACCRRSSSSPSTARCAPPTGSPARTR